MRLVACVACVAVLVGLSISSGCATAPPAPPKPPPSYSGHFSRFPTGLRMVAYQLPHATRGVVVASYLGGSADDPPGKEGLAVLAGRLAQRAMPGGVRIRDRLLAAGVENGHEVGPDALVLWQMGAESDLGEMLRIEGERLRDPASGISQAEVDRERAAVALALSATPESGDAAPISWLSQLAFAGHPYGKPRLGTPSTLAAITLADVQGWLRTHITPARAVLVVTSGGAPRAAERAIVDACGSVVTGVDGAIAVPAQAPVARPAIVVSAAAPRPTELRRSASLYTRLWLGWSLPATTVADRVHAMRAAVSVEMALERGLGRESADAVLDVSADVHPSTGATLVSVRLDLASRDAVKTVLADAVAVLDRPFAIADDAALTRFARSQLPTTFAAEVARHVQMTGRPDLAAEWSAVRPADAAPWIREHVTGARAVSLTVAPDPVTPLRPTPLLVATSLLERASVAFDAQPLDADPLPPGVRDRPRSAGAPQPALAHRVLPNGVTLLAMPIPDQELVARLVVRNPGRDADEAMAGVLAFATGQRTFSFFGANSCWSAIGGSSDAVHFSNAGRAADADEVLAKLACWTGGIAARAETFKGAAGKIRKGFEDLSRSPAVRGWDAMRAALYPGHGQSRPLSALGGGVDRKAAEEWMRGAMRPDRATVLLAGEIPDPAALLDAAEKRFGRWKRSDYGGVPDSPAAPWPERRQVIAVPQPGARGAHVTVAVRMPPAGARDEPAQRAVQRLLEARIAALGEELSLSGVLLAQHDVGAGSALLASAWVSSLDPSAAVKRILEVVAAIGDAPPSETAIQRVQLEQLHEARARFSSTPIALLLATGAVAVGEDLERWSAEPASISTLTPARVQAAARTLAVGREVVVVVGEPWLADGLTTAGFEVERLPQLDES